MARFRDDHGDLAARLLASLDVHRTRIRDFGGVDLVEDGRVVSREADALGRLAVDVAAGRCTDIGWYDLSQACDTLETRLGGTSKNRIASAFE